MYKKSYSQSNHSQCKDTSEPIARPDMTASKPGTSQDIAVIPDFGADLYRAYLDHGVSDNLIEVVDCKAKIKTEKITNLKTSNNLVF